MEMVGNVNCTLLLFVSDKIVKQIASRQQLG